MCIEPVPSFVAETEPYSSCTVLLCQPLQVKVSSLVKGRFNSACSIGSSGCRENVALTWEKCGLERWFEASVCANDVTHCKPSPEIFLTAATRLGLQPEECIVFEDAVSGVEAAKAAGMKVVTITTTLPRERLEEAGADLIIDSFDEVNYEVLSNL